MSTDENVAAEAAASATASTDLIADEENTTNEEPGEVIEATPVHAENELEEGEVVVEAQDNTVEDAADVKTENAEGDAQGVAAQPALEVLHTKQASTAEIKLEPQLTNNETTGAEVEEKSDNGESKSEADPAEDSAASKELPYSTRGRSTDKGTTSGEERSSSVDILEEIGRVKETSPTTMGTSFLESLSEEERRTRTRFVPDVEGMHALQKNEIKDDLSLARSLVSSSGITSLKKTRAPRVDAMDVDGGVSPSEDAPSGARVLELPARDLIVPSNAFIAPGVTGSDDEGQTTSIASLKTENGIKSPLVVDSVVGFNPPRPPESVGAKKKHRMLRWERRPEDVEVDLNNYRKTVQRTREELAKAEAEYNRLQTIDAHLRWNFLNHLNAMNEEYTKLNEEIGSVQQECVKAADLLTSRTRSRGAGKGSYVMRDVLSVFKSKGIENTDAMEVGQHPIIENPVSSAGIGGLANSVFTDWNRSSAITQKEPASAWIVPGDKVKTTKGEGLVVEVFPPENALSQKDAATSSTEKVATEENAPEVSAEEKTQSVEGDGRGSVLVKLPSGVEEFSINVIKAIENPCLFSDAKLASRWTNLVKSALSISGTIDLEGMNFNPKEKSSDQDKTENDHDRTGIDVDGAANHALETNTEEAVGKNQDEDEDHFMPFGAGLLPTANGRGNLLQNIPFDQLEKAMENALYNGRGVLGDKSNQGVTEDLRKWEDEEQEYLTLQAKALQLRNTLIRQKRIRLNHERTNATTAERYHRSAELVVEMRSDLKSLKHRLHEELKELGLDEQATKKILSQYYLGQDSPVDVGEASPLKRSRCSIGRVQGENPTSYSAESGDDQDLSGDDMEVRPPNKRPRPSQ